ncbi:MAG: ATP-binding cassette domain-containing protein, partial [Alphaproteobacteria bacterium]|nr:ATP-binding cassette domain-containing protein [Alphaproteobacteria bacterium]
MALLSVRGLTTRFRTDRGELTAVDDVSFDLDEGETLAIVGESGSGKSVTALSLMRLIAQPAGRIDAGTAMFEGKDLLRLPEEEMRAVRGDRIAMIFQEPMTSLNPSISVGAQVAEPMVLHRGSTWQAAMARAGELLDRVRLPDARARVNAYPH